MALTELPAIRAGGFRFASPTIFSIFNFCAEIFFLFFCLLSRQESLGWAGGWLYCWPATETLSIVLNYRDKEDHHCENDTQNTGYMTTRELQSYIIALFSLNLWQQI